LASKLRELLDLHNHVLTTYLGSAKFVFGDALKPYIRDGKVQFDVVYAEAMANYEKSLFISRNSLKSTRRPHWCPHWLLGKKPRGCHGSPACPEFGYLGFDHVDSWVHDRKPSCISSQPYSLSAEAMANLARLETRHDLRVWVTADSFYFPTRTLLVVVSRPPTGEST